MNHFWNQWVIWLLRSPLHGVLSRGLLLITVTGRKSGRRYTTPVEYRLEADCVTIISRQGRTWWKNITGGAPVTLHLRGRDVRGQAAILSLSDSDLQRVIHARYPAPLAHKLEAERDQLVVIGVVLER
jgi:deazaflavin-dependent oxidoreductase (nitroreductase family)